MELPRFDPAAGLAWLQANGELLTTIAGTAIVLILGTLIIRAYRRGGIDSATMLIAAPLVIGWEAEGIYEVLVGTDAPWFLALIGCGMTSMVMVNLGAKGHKHFKEHGTIGPNGRTVWYIAIPVGVIVAASATTASMQGLRILIPILGATLWWSEYRPDEPDGKKKARGSLRWTPRNFGIWIGAIRPGDDDVETLHHARGVRQLVNAQYRVKYGRFTPRSWREAALRRVARSVTDAMVDEAEAQMARVALVVERTAPVGDDRQGSNLGSDVEGPTDETPDGQDRPSGRAARKPRGTARGGRRPAVETRRELVAWMEENPGATKTDAAAALNLDLRYTRRLLNQGANTPGDDDQGQTPGAAANSGHTTPRPRTGRETFNGTALFGIPAVQPA